MTPTGTSSPLSDFRFESPLSYWNPEYFGGLMWVAEVGLVVGLTIHLSRRYRSWWWRGGLLAANAYYAVLAWWAARVWS